MALRRTTIFKQLIINIAIPTLLALLIFAAFNFQRTRSQLERSNEEKNRLLVNEVTKILRFQDIAINLIEDEFNNRFRELSSKLVNDYFTNTDNLEDIDLRKVEFAGANNPLILIRNNMVNRYKGDRFPIGAYEGDDPQNFANNIIDLKSGDCLYLFSDGYADQFGGLDGKKFMYKRFEQLLLEIHALPMDEQKETLNKRLLKWKGSNDQVDDILVIGIKI